MILNNYNNSLPENKETSLSFICNRTPILTVRYFDPVLKVGDHLIIPYYVNAYDDRYFRKNYFGDTYTTIIRLDEDTVSLEDVIEHKQTTFSGEQIIDLGSINTAGLHSFSIQTIESSGIASPVQYFKFLVHETSFGTNILDFDTVNSFSSISDYPDKHYCGETTRLQYTAGNGMHQVLNYGVNRPECYITNNATYSVIKVIDNGILKGIEITVSGSIHYDMVVSSNSSHDVDISGTYYVTNDFIDENNTPRNLLDYLDTPALELPQSAVIAAAKNKIGLTRLFEAAKSTGCDKFIMPHGFNIVVDYHSADGSVTSLERTRTDEEFGNNRCNIKFPNNFIIDFNECVIKCLQTVDIGAGSIIKMDSNFNTHICNLIASGNYKNYDIAASKTHGAGSTSESLNVISMSCCYFCSYNNITTSFSCGYDLVSGEDIPSSLVSENTKIFNKTGYIDYAGIVHNIPVPDVTDGNKKMQYYYSDLTTPWAILIKTPNSAFTTYYKNVGINHIRIGMTSTWGMYNTSTRKGQCNFGFIHYYNKNNAFLKTVKFQYNEILIIPKDAVYIRLSAKGTKASNTIDSLFKSNGEPNVRQMSQRSGFGNKIVNCKAHDTRSCICGYSGNQFLNDKTISWNIAQEDSMPDPITSDVTSGWHITSMLVDIENMSMFFANACLRDFECIYSKNKSTKIKYTQKANFLRPRSVAFTINDIDRGCIKGACNCTVVKGTNAASDITAVEESYIQLEDCYFTSARANGEGSNTFVNRTGLYLKDSTINYCGGGTVVNNSNIS